MATTITVGKPSHKSCYFYSRRLVSRFGGGSGCWIWKSSYRHFHRPEFSFSTTTASTSTKTTEKSESNDGIVVDNDPCNNQESSSPDTHKKYKSHQSRTTIRKRLPHLNLQHYHEFPSSSSSSSSSLSSSSRSSSFSFERRQYMFRITKMAIERVLEPPTLHLLAAAAGAALSVAAVEGYLLCRHQPFVDPNVLPFIARYSVEQLFPSVVWGTNDANLVAMAMNIDPVTLLNDTSGTTPESASLVLKTQLLTSSRHFWAGFMMLGQFLRAASISFDIVKEYEQRIQLGQEPPFLLKRRSRPWFFPSVGNIGTSNGGLVVRLCGVRSHVSEVSLSKMGTFCFFPVFEEPSRIQFLVRKYSNRFRVPVYWCVPPSQYGSSYAWDHFPVDEACFMTGENEQDKILVLEADATNGNDPLALGDTALDLTIDDASQAFRRILDRYYTKSKLVAGKDFRTLRVYLGNSMELQTTGGGHRYTLRHRVRYAKEVDVLVDSRAPVLKKVLEWCQAVASKDRAILFQTSSREYFLSLKRLLEQYGYTIYDPLDLRAMKLMADRKNSSGRRNNNNGNMDAAVCDQKSFLSVLLQDESFIQEHIRDWEEDALFLHGMMGSNPDRSAKNLPADVDETREDDYNDDMRALLEQEEQRQMLQSVAKMASLPRLVHMRTTAETVNAVEALVMAGEVDANNCCALIDRKEGVQALERTLRRETQFVQESNQSHQWSLYERIMPTSANGGTPEREDEDDDDDPDRTVTTGGLQIICSSSIHDNLFRQCRQWARMGYSAVEIQSEFDAQYVDLLQQMNSVQQEVREVVTNDLSSPAASEEEKIVKKDGNGPTQIIDVD